MWVNSKKAYQQAEAMAAQMAKKKDCQNAKKQIEVVCNTPGSLRKPCLSGSFATVDTTISDLGSSHEWDTISVNSGMTLGSNVKAVLPVHQAQDLLDKIQNVVKEQQNQEANLNQLLEEQKELCKARYVNQNETGAILSMKRIHKLRTERERATQALDVALEAACDIETAIVNARTAAFAKRGIEEGPGKKLWFMVDIGENAHALQEVDFILHEMITEESSKLTRPLLLQHVKALVG